MKYHGKVYRIRVVQIPDESIKRYYPEYAVKLDKFYYDSKLEWKPIELTGDGSNYLDDLDYCKKIIDLVSESNLNDTDHYLEEIIYYNGIHKN